MKPILYTDCTLRGYEILRVWAIVYQMQEGRLRPFSALSSPISEVFHDYISAGAPCRDFAPNPKRPYVQYHDIDYCRTEGIHYHHESGCGPFPPCKDVFRDEDAVWVDWTFVSAVVRPPRRWANSAKLLRQLKLFRPACLQAQKLRLLRHPVKLGKGTNDVNPLQSYPGSYCAEVGTVEYCSVCRDWLPEESDRLCDHLSWCDECGVYTGPGGTEGLCGCEDKDQQPN